VGFDTASEDLLAEALTQDGYTTIAIESVDRSPNVEAAFVVIDHQRLGDRFASIVAQLWRTMDLIGIVAVLPAHAIDAEAQALVDGASELLVRPFHPAQLSLLLERMVRHDQLLRSEARLRELLERRQYLDQLVGGSAPMRSLYQLIEEVAPGDIPILILGEEGTEKVATAQTLHARGGKGDRPLVEIDLQLAAERDRALAPETFARVGNGSLVLYEIGFLSLEQQQTLLDILNDRRVPVRVGGPNALLRSRFIATSTEDLFARVQAGTFLKQLFYRISSVQMMLPALRERQDDIPLLIGYRLRRANKRRGTRVTGFSNDALLALMTYPWPGNLRELDEVVDEVVQLCQKGEAARQHLPVTIFEAGLASSAGEQLAAISFRDARDRFERQYLTELLRLSRGNMTLAAERSGVGRPYLYKKLQEYSLRPSDFRAKGERGSSEDVPTKPVLEDFVGDAELAEPATNEA